MFLRRFVIFALLIINAVLATMPILNSGLNLLENANAESGDPAPWVSTVGSLRVVTHAYLAIPASYGITDGDFGGTYAFEGQSTSGVTSQTRAVQTILLDQAASSSSASSAVLRQLNATELAMVDRGEIQVDLSGWLGGYSSQLDQPSLWVSFASNVSSDAVQHFVPVLGPVSAAMRHSNTMFMPVARRWPVPSGTRVVYVNLLMEKLTASGGDNDGYIDNLNVTLTTRQTSLFGRNALNTTTWAASLGEPVVDEPYSWLGLPEAVLPPPDLRGAYFFHGAATPSMASIAAVEHAVLFAGELLSQVKNSTAQAELSAWLGGWSTFNDAPSVVVRCFDETGSSTALAAVSLGPLTPTDRTGVSGFVRRSLVFSPPADSTACITQLVMDKIDSSHADNNAYIAAVNLTFTIKPPFEFDLGSNLMSEAHGVPVPNWVPWPGSPGLTRRAYASDFINWAVSSLPPAEFLGPDEVSAYAGSTSSATVTATRRIDIMVDPTYNKLRASVANGTAVVFLSAFLGGYSTVLASAALRLSFLTASGGPAGDALWLEPVTMWDRGGYSGFLRRTNRSAVPPLTSTIALDALLEAVQASTYDAVFGALNLTVVEDATLAATLIPLPSLRRAPPPPSDYIASRQRSKVPLIPPGPISIAVVATLPLRGTRGVALFKQHARVAVADDWSGGLKIIDVSDPLSPRVLTAWIDNNGNYAKRVVISNDERILFAAFSMGGLYVFLVSDDGTRLNQIRQFGGTYDEDLALGPSGNVMYAGMSDGFEVFNVSSPAEPFRVAALTTGQTTMGFAFDPRNASVMIAATSAGLLCVDVTDPRNPRIMGSALTQFAFVAIEFDETRGLIYAAEESQYFVTLSRNYASQSKCLFVEHAIVVDGSPLKTIAVHQAAGLVLVGLGSASLAVVDVTSVESAVLGTVAGLVLPIGIAWTSNVTATTAFVADYTGGLRLVKVQRQSALLSSSIRQRSFVPLADYALGVVLSPKEELAYVSIHQRGLQVVSVASLDAIKPLAYTTTWAAGNSRFAVLASATNRSFVAQDSNDAGLLVVDVSNPTMSPLPLLAQYRFGNSRGVALSPDESVLMFCDTSNGLHFVNVSMSPPQVYFTVPCNCEKVVLGPVAPVVFAVGSCQAFIVDIRDPSQPSLVKWFQPPSGCLQFIAVSPTESLVAVLGGSLLYVGDIRDLDHIVWSAPVTLSFPYGAEFMLDGTAVIVHDFDDGIKVFDIFDVAASDATLLLSLRFLFDTPGQTRAGKISSDGETLFAVDGMYGLAVFDIGPPVLGIVSIFSSDVLDPRPILRVGIETKGSVDFIARDGSSVQGVVQDVKLVESPTVMWPAPFWFSLNTVTRRFFGVPTKEYSSQTVTLALTVSVQSSVVQTWIRFWIQPSLAIVPTPIADDVLSGLPYANRTGVAPRSAKLVVQTPASMMALKITSSRPSTGRFIVSDDFGAVAISYHAPTGVLNALGTTSDINRMLDVIRFAVLDPSPEAASTTFTLSCDDTINVAQAKTADFTAFATNVAPTVIGSVPSHSAKRGKAFEFTVDTQRVFYDPDDELSFAAATAGAFPAVLPSWLVFNPTTATFSGSTDLDIVVVLNISATDKYGVAWTVFSLTVTDSSPFARWTPLVNLTEPVKPLVPFDLRLSPTAFSDPDDSVLTFTASLKSGLALPSWIIFDPIALSFTGTAPTDVTLGIVVSASDGYLSGRGEFNFTAFDAPPFVAVAPPDAIVTKLGRSFVSGLEATFSDPDDRVLTFSMTQSNGNPLPSWLVFDKANVVLSGTPKLEDAELSSLNRTANYTKGVEVAFTASDGLKSASCVVRLVIVDAAPYAIEPDAVLRFTAKAKSSTVVTLPRAVVSDPDDASLVFSLAGLPARWATFDPVTMVLSLTPTELDLAKNFTGSLTATDGFLTATVPLVVMVPQNDAPYAKAPHYTVTWFMSQDNSFQPLSDLFVDPNSDAMTYSVDMENGAVVPNWMTFDASKGVLSGNGGDSVLGDHSLRLWATDIFGATANATLQITLKRSDWDMFLYVVTILGYIASVVGPAMAAYEGRILLQNIVKGKRHMLKRWPFDEKHVFALPYDGVQFVQAFREKELNCVTRRVAGLLAKLSIFLHTEFTHEPLQNGELLPPWVEYDWVLNEITLKFDKTHAGHSDEVSLLLKVTDEEGLVFCTVMVDPAGPPAEANGTDSIQNPAKHEASPPSSSPIAKDSTTNIGAPLLRIAGRTRGQSIAIARRAKADEARKAVFNEELRRLHDDDDDI